MILDDKMVVVWINLEKETKKNRSLLNRASFYQSLQWLRMISEHLRAAIGEVHNHHDVYADIKA